MWPSWDNPSVIPEASCLRDHSALAPRDPRIKFRAARSVEMTSLLKPPSAGTVFFAAPFSRTFSVTSPGLRSRCDTIDKSETFSWRIMRTISFQGRWAFIAGAAVGILVAFPLAAPLFSGKILEPVATLWGNALGAIGAIAAAIWASDRASSLQRRQGASLILAFIAPIGHALTQLTHAYSILAPVDDGSSRAPTILDEAGTKEVGALCFLTNGAYYKFKEAGSRIENVITLLGPEEMTVFFALEAELETMSGVVGQLMHHVGTSAEQIYGHTPSTGLRTRLLKTHDHVKRYLTLIERAAR